MKEIFEWLKGKRTYGTCAVVCVVVFGSWQGWWKVPAEVYAGLSAIAIGFLRAGVAGEMEKLMRDA